MIKWMIALILASVSMSGMAIGASSIEGFAGRWAGHAIDMPGAMIPVEAISIEIRDHDGGFELFWNDLTRVKQGAEDDSSLQARFVSTGREGVFEYAPKPGSFLDRMFASPATGNPLRGETLLWARVDAQTLAVYSLTIGETGDFNLDRYTWTRTDDGLALHFQERTQELGEKTSIHGQLVPAEG